MKHSNSNKLDSFQSKTDLFKKLLIGSKMAKLSCIILVIISLVLIYIARENMKQVIALLLGVVAVVSYVFKFLPLSEIKQKSYTQTSFNSSVYKFKTYISNRKRYEIYFMAIWIISLTPFAIDQLGSKFEVFIGAFFYIVFVSFLGLLAFEKVEKTISTLEVVTDEEM